MLGVCKRHAQLHTSLCLGPSSPFLHTHVRVLKLETASTVSEGNQTFLGCVVKRKILRWRQEIVLCMYWFLLLTVPKSQRRSASLYFK